MANRSIYRVTRANLPALEDQEAVLYDWSGVIHRGPWGRMGFIGRIVVTDHRIMFLPLVMHWLDMVIPRLRTRVEIRINAVEAAELSRRRQVCGPLPFARVVTVVVNDGRRVRFSVGRAQKLYGAIQEARSADSGRAP